MNKTVTIILLLVTLYICTSKAYGQEIRTFEGVRIVDNTGINIKNNNGIELDFIRTIGDTEGSNENLMFFRPTDLEIDDSWNLYILDQGNFRVQVFDRNLNYLKSFGTQGQGPGEFARPKCIGIDEENKIWVLDVSNGRMEIFSLEEGFIEGRKLPKIFTDFIFLKNGKLLCGPREMGSVLVEMEMAAIEGKRPEKPEVAKSVFSIKNKDFEIVNEFGKARILNDMFLDMRVNNTKMTTDSDGNIIAAYIWQNLIEKYTQDGRLLLKIMRKLNYKSEPYRKNNGKLGMNRVAAGVAVDEKDRIWTVTLNRVAPPMEMERLKETETDMFDVEVFSGNGILKAKFKFNHFIDAIKIYGNRLYILDTYRKMQIFEYRISG